MVRPTVIVTEPEPIEALSVRKLVLETAKFNVLTAHTTREAIDLHELFPNVSAVVIAAGRDIDPPSITATIKSIASRLPVICLYGQIGAQCPAADYSLSSHEPEKLLELLRSLLGDPRQLD